MRMWDDSFDRYPFQALECRLDNVYKIKDYHNEAIAHLEHLVLEHSITATVR